MNCIEFVENISLYIDGDMNEEEKKEFELHLSECSNCRQEYEFMINIIREVKEQEQVELPDNYRFELRRKLKEVSKEEKREKKINWRVLSTVAAGLVIMLISFSMLSNNLPFNKKENKEDISLLVNESEQNLMNAQSEQKQEKTVSDTSSDESLGTTMAIYGVEDSSAQTTASEDNTEEELTMASIPMEEDGMVKSFGGDIASRSILGNSRKSIKEAYLSIELERIDIAEEQITKYVKENGGYIEILDKHSYESDENNETKSLIIKIRIPTDKFDESLEFLKQLGTIIEEKSYYNDVTDEYLSIEANLKSLYEKEDSLLDILNRTEKEEDRLLVEEELKEVKEKITSEINTLEKYEESINLPTINTEINEVSDND